MRRRFVALVATALGVSLLGVTPVAAPAARAGSCSSVRAIGDSVMLGAAAQLKARGITVDARKSRQFSSSVYVGTSHTVVIHLGTNGPFSKRSLDALLRRLASRRVVLVTIQLPNTSRYSYEAGLNSLIRGAASRYTNVRIADWNVLSGFTPGLLTRDGIHLTGQGRTAYANLVAGAAC